jgi:hypothetical protein
MKIVYFVSSTHPYERAIYPGVGPLLARSFDWPTAFISDIGETQFDVGIVDNRLEKGDVTALEKYLARDAKLRSPILFRISDPDMPRSTNGNIRFIFQQADKPSVHYATVYQPEGALLEFAHSLRSSVLVDLPYPYDKTRELDLDVAYRKRAVFLSGAAGKRVYPLRQLLRRQRHWNICLRSRIFDLTHPGYPEHSSEPRHEFTHERYVTLASRFTHFFLCPSIYEIELMKFLECAYAGCVPFGQCAKTLTAYMGVCFISYSGRSQDIAKELTAPLDELRYRAMEYRKIMWTIRAPQTILARLKEQIRHSILRHM